jgi:hypothetical protein
VSAETLRRAAAQMRERAEALPSEARWETEPDGPWARIFPADSDSAVATMPADHADYFASWHPAVAVAVASLIHEISCSHYPLRAAEHLDPYGCATCYPGDSDWPCVVFDEALAVARAYLGESA